MLTPIDFGVFFIFVDETTHTSFINKTNAGIVLLKDKGPQTAIPRWGVVIQIAEAVTDVLPGDYILVEAGMWTSSFDTSGMRLWKTEESKILAVSLEAPDAVI